MKTTYFKTEKAFQNYLNELQQDDVMITRGTVTCAGGETNGARVYDNTRVMVEVVILDEAEYDNASNFDKGE